MMRSIIYLLPLAWRNLWRSPRRTGITLAVIAIGMWSILIFGVMLKAWATSSRDESLRLLTGEGQIHAQGYTDDPNVAHRMPWPDHNLEVALNSPNVAAWAPRIRVPAVIQSEYRTRAITFLGVVPRQERGLSDLPSQIALGRYLVEPHERGIVIGRDLAARLKTRLGKRLIVMAQAADGHLAEAGFAIVGIFNANRPAEDEFVFTGLITAQSLLGAQSDLSEISFNPSPSESLDRLVSTLRRTAPSLDVEPWKLFAPLAYTMETFSQSYIAIWLMVMFTLMAIGIVNTQLMAVFERKREFGLLQALGMRPWLIVAQVTLESALLVAVGIAAGVALTVIALAPFRNGLDLGILAAGAELYGAGRVLHPSFDAAAAAQSCIIIWLLGVAASFWPARTAARASPVMAMSEL